MSRLLVRAVLCAALGMMACHAPAGVDAMPGTYVMNRGRAADTLVVRADHSYERRYTMPGSAAVIDRGTWSIDTLDHERYVTFDRFPARWRAETFPGGTSESRGFWPVTPERTITGAIVLGVDPDLDWEYRKVSVAF